MTKDERQPRGKRTRKPSLVKQEKDLPKGNRSEVISATDERLDGQDMRITPEDFYLAYRKLKSMAYFDSGGLVLKEQIANFEKEILEEEADRNNWDERFRELFIDRITQIHSELVANNEDFLKKGKIRELIDKTGHRLVPKCFKGDKEQNNTDECGRLITNDFHSDRCLVEKFNVMIEAPLEIHILSVLWLMKVASEHESEIPVNNYANRLSSFCNVEDEDGIADNCGSGLMLFRPYFRGYQDWRDRGLQKAIELLDSGHDCALLSLDIRRYFYSVRMNVLRSIPETNKEEDLLYRLTLVIQAVHEKYADSTADIDFLKISDENRKNGEYSLPVGLPSSGWLANWYLVNFDNKILKEVNPEYYGRYVDDLIFVFRNAALDGDNDCEKISNFIERHFLKTEMLHKTEEGYCIEAEGTVLNIQGGKVILQYFRHDESRAAINKFKKNIDRNRSEFRYLPFNDMVDVEFDDEAFSLEYSDSVNKFRSLKSLSENKFGASTYLAHKIFLAQFSAESQGRNKDGKLRSANQILSFFRGKTALDMYRLWEKVATYFLLTSDYTGMARFYRQVHSAIDNLSFESPDNDNPDIVAEKDVRELQKSLKTHLDLSFAMAFSLCPGRIESMTGKLKAMAGDNEKVADIIEPILEKAHVIRDSYLFRHNYVRIPGICYTIFNDGESDLTQFPDIDSGKLDVNTDAGFRSPVFVHFHDFNLLGIVANIGNPSLRPNELLNKSHKDFHKFNYEWQGLEEPKPFFNVKDCGNNCLIDIKDTKNDGEQHGTIPDKRIGIANWHVDRKDCESALRKTFRLTKKHKDNLFYILNYANKHNVEFVALPELAVPIQLLPLLTRQCSRQEMAVVSGLNYIVKGKDAFNYTVTILPIRTRHYTTCVIIPRLKNYPAPDEIHAINGLYLKEVYPQPPRYDLFHWRKVYFSVYNCFELSNITDRALFKSKVDFIIASEFNRDVPYYSNVIESWARDLHCYIVQVNTSDFGDSRVVQPTSTFKKDIMSISGGTEPLLLVDTLRIDTIRDFQEHAYCWQLDTDGGKGLFKPTPPQFELKNTRCRRRDLPLSSDEWES